jgi:predicted nuclease of predicted toxin-antitoxin system
MKLPVDQNLSWRLSRNLEDIFPESIHVREISFAEAEDKEIWEYAKANGFVIVSKDTDFQQKNLFFGHPPKVVWLRVGNCNVEIIESLLRKHSVSIHTFGIDETNSILILP